MAIVPHGKSVWDSLSEAEKSALASAEFEEIGWLLSADVGAEGQTLSERGLVKPRRGRWALTPPGHNVRAFRLRRSDSVIS